MRWIENVLNTNISYFSSTLYTTIGSLPRYPHPTSCRSTASSPPLSAELGSPGSLVAPRAAASADAASVHGVGSLALAAFPNHRTCAWGSPAMLGVGSTASLPGQSSSE